MPFFTELIFSKSFYVISEIYLALKTIFKLKKKNKLWRTHKHILFIFFPY